MAEIAGLKLIVPSSVSATGAGSSASVSASGKVTFSTAETISVNGVFSATYDNYLMVLIYTASTGNSIRIRLRASGSDASGANYTRQALYANGAAVSGTRATGQTYADVQLNDASTTSGTHLFMYGPYLSQPTAGRSVSASTRDVIRIGDFALTHSLSTSYDGFTLVNDVQNVTGSLTVYGLSQ